MCDKVKKAFVAELDPDSVETTDETLSDYGRRIEVMTYRIKGGEKYYGRWRTLKSVGNPETHTNDHHDGYPNNPFDTPGEARAYALEHAKLYFRDLK